jgi:hypothetical protein
MAIELTPLHPTLGAEVRGVDLARPVMPEVFAEIDAAFWPEVTGAAPVAIFCGIITTPAAFAG